MERLIILYSFFLVIFSSMTIFLTLASPHHVDSLLTLFNRASIISFPVTVYLLIRFFPSRKHQWLTIFLLGVNCIVFYYYCYDLYINNHDGLGDILLAIFFPVINLLLSIFFLAVIIKNMVKAEKH